MERKIEEREISQLKPHPKQQMFKPPKYHEIVALADDIGRNGLLNQVEITSDGVIICGHRRVEAMQRLKRKTVSCWVRVDLEKKGEAAIEARFVEDNLHRRQMGKLEMVRAFEARKNALKKSGVRDQSGTARDFVAKSFDKSGRTLDRYLQILKAPVSVQNAWDDGRLTDAEVQRVLRSAPKVQRMIGKRIALGKDPKMLVKNHTAVIEKYNAASMGQALTLVSRSITRVQNHVGDLEKVSLYSWRDFLPAMKTANSTLDAFVKKLERDAGKDGLERLRQEVNDAQE